MGLGSALGNLAKSGKSMGERIANKVASRSDGNFLAKQFLNDPEKGVSLANISKLQLFSSAFFTINDFNEQRNEGKGFFESALNAGATMALSTVLPWWAYMGIGVMSAVPGMAVEGYDTLNRYGRKLQRQSRNTPFQNATFLDSQQTYTMRQAGMNLARQGRYAAQQAMLGNEAQSVSAAYAGRRY